MQIVLDLRDEMNKEAFEASWDSNKKSFVHNAEELTLDGFNAVKKAARSIQGKYAMMYGAIGATVLGVVGYLCGGIGANKATPEAIQKVDKQA